jgi:hypothetical protein
MEEEMPGREQRSEDWKMPQELMRANTRARAGEVGGKENATGIDGEGNPGGIDGRENAGKQSKKSGQARKIQKGWIASEKKPKKDGDQLASITSKIKLGGPIGNGQMGPFPGIFRAKESFFHTGKAAMDTMQ